MNKALFLTRVAVAAMFIFSVIQMSLAMPESMVSVEPPNISVSPGEIFTVDIMVDPGDAEVMGASYHLYFDNILLNCTKQEKGDFLSQDGASTMEMTNEINNTFGEMKYGEMRKLVERGVTTRDALATVTFKAIEPGTCSLNLTEVKLYDSRGNKIESVVLNNGTCNIGISQASTPTPTSTPTLTPTPKSGDSDNGDASTTPTPRLPPLPSGENNDEEPTQTPGSTPTQVPTITPVSSPSQLLSPTAAGISPIPTASTTPPAPEEHNRLHGFEVILAIAGLLAASYLILKKKIGGDR